MKKLILEPNFSDEINTLCKKCKEFKSKCICNNKEIKIIPKDKHKIKSKLTKYNNKIISSFYPFYINNEKEILKILKKKLGCGGSIEVIEDYIQINLQGDLINKANGLLKDIGFN